MRSADLVLYVIDGVQGLTEQDQQLMADLKNQPVIYLLNKSDLGISDIVRQQVSDAISHESMLEISAQEKNGLEQLEQKITDLFFAGTLEVSNQILVTNVRHIQILEESLAHLAGFLSGLELGLSVDFLVIDLQNAWEKLGKILAKQWKMIC